MVAAVAEHGADWLYSSETADKLSQEVQAAGGIITKDDITNVQPDIVKPLKVEVRIVMCIGLCPMCY